MRKQSQEPGYALRLLKQRLARRQRQLLDPNYGEFCSREDRAGDQHPLQTEKVPKQFPIFFPGMSTGAYIALFQRLNEQRRPSTRLGFVCASGPAPTLDPSWPEVVNEGVS